MQLTTTDIGFFLLLAALVAVVIVLTHANYKANRMLMWFHGAGRGLADSELKLAELDVRKKEAEAVTAQANAQRVQAEIKAMTPETASRFGANGKREILS